MRHVGGGLGRRLAFACAALLAAVGVGRADELADLKARLEAQEREIRELRSRVDAAAANDGAKPDAKADGKADGKGAKDAKGAKKEEKKLDEKAVNKMIDDYLKSKPGAGMPPGVQTGFELNKGWFIRSPDNPSYVPWDDLSKIPFEMRIRGRIQMPYYFYKTTDSVNHLTRVDTFNNTSPDFDQLEIKRMRLIFEGSAYDPDLRYHIQLDGNTRGLGGLAGGGVPGTTGLTSVGGVPGGNGNTTVDHAVRLFSAFVAYDFHPCWAWKGCACDCPEGSYKYVPTYTLILGKIKPFMSYEEVMGSATEQMVEYAMSEWYFDADDDNLLMAAGFQIKELDDRLYVQGLITNGNETQIANLQMDDFLGFNLGGWYDFGGTWDDKNHRWVLYGDSLSDIDYSCCPVLRVGGALNLVPMDRRSEFTNAELNRVRTVPGAPGGTSLLGILNGDGINVNAAGIGQFAADKFDSYTYEAFASAHYRGFSVTNDWWFRDINNIRGRKFPAGNYPGNGRDQPILYTSNFGTALFPDGVGLFDFGSSLQAGYFIIPKKVELVARYSFVRGQTGDINGTGTFATLTPAQQASLGIPATAGPIRVVNNAFRDYHQADEIAFGVNYFIKRHFIKWQTDFSLYRGGNPAAGGQSPAGFIPGVDGWMVRTQFQLMF